MLISMVVVFGTCWLPLQTINFIADLNLVDIFDKVHDVRQMVEQRFADERVGKLAGKGAAKIAVKVAVRHRFALASMGGVVRKFPPETAFPVKRRSVGTAIV